MLHLAFALLLALPQQSADDAHALLDARICELQQGGYGDIAVAILPDLGGYSPNEVSVAIYRAWRVGSVVSPRWFVRNVFQSRVGRPRRLIM